MLVVLCSSFITQPAFYSFTCYSWRWIFFKISQNCYPFYFSLGYIYIFAGGELMTENMGKHYITIYFYTSTDWHVLSNGWQSFLLAMTLCILLYTSSDVWISIRASPKQRLVLKSSLQGCPTIVAFACKIHEVHCQGRTIRPHNHPSLRIITGLLFI